MASVNVFARRLVSSYRGTNAGRKTETDKLEDRAQWIRVLRETVEKALTIVRHVEEGSGLEKWTKWSRSWERRCTCDGSLAVNHELRC